MRQGDRAGVETAPAALAQAEALRQYLPGFTAYFAAWVAQQVEAKELTRQLYNGFDVSVKGYRDKLTAAMHRQASTGRIVQNWAVLVTLYRVLHQFLMEHDADAVLPPWQDAVVETARAVRQERASEVFLDVLVQLLASGAVMLMGENRQPADAPPGVTIVGYRDANYVYLLPEVAYREVNRIQPLKFTPQAIGSQFREDGWLVASPNQPHLTVQMRVRGTRVRVWRLRAEVIDGGPSEE